MILTREQLERREREFLAPYAMHSGDSRGRVYPDDEHPYRTAYQKDRDRVIHTTAFRRLEYKTQVFVYHEGDHYRNRLTHSIEVAQIGRTMSRALGANEDLTEAICLAHDLGHPPFGHTGEHVLNDLMEGYGGFDHQRQTMRIVERLEGRYPGFPGLNLTYEVREGLVKHDTIYDVTDATGYEPNKAGTLECQLANLADEIAYSAADLEDGLRSGILDPRAVAELALWQKLHDVLTLDPSYPVADDAPLSTLIRSRTVRKLIGALVTDSISTTSLRLDDLGFDSDDALRSYGKNVATFSPEMHVLNEELKAFLLEDFYRNWRVHRMAAKAQRILRDLFNSYCEDPRQLPPDTQDRLETSGDTMQRVICDYIAGMTDRYAIQEHQKLFDPEARV
ncbi:MAG: deoxyguanosinetriphosphate triphosphohydrolase [Anaerolineae bacterium]|nr:deoxyguanosinetriphosphate triphosphohydrolase [Anaerolineae bacterium]MCO5246477.1 deoxyguanosinetriphosphate triphosphohydrolase [Anaerolineae bacterium]